MSEADRSRLEFLDSNIIIYALGEPEDRRSEVSLTLSRRLLRAGNGAVSSQVLLESAAVLRRRTQMPAKHLIDGLASYMMFAIVRQPESDLFDAITLAERWVLSVYDAMILVAARRCGAAIVWSEDMKHGEDYDGVIVRNPFLDPAYSSL